MKFELEINRLIDIKDSLVIKFRKVEGSTSSYREICLLILSQSNLQYNVLKLFCQNMIVKEI